MLISCGIQWLAQPARYLSQAHLYLNGTSWLTSVWPLMMRLSAAFTRRLARSPSGLGADGEFAMTGAALGAARTSSSHESILCSLYATIFNAYIYQIVQ